MISFLKKTSTATLFLFLFIISTVYAQPDIKTVEQNVNQRLSAGNILGVSIAYVYPDGRTQFISRGSLTTERTKTVDKNTIFEIGSISKTFTTLIMAKMAEEGSFSLDATIDTFLPDSVNVPSYNGKKITLRHLATHTSGLPRLPDNLSPSDPANPYTDYTAQKLYAFLDHYKLTKAPGTSFAYSNLGMGLLGHILESISGKSYAQLLKQFVTEPLGMNETGLNVSAQKQRRFAAPYNYGQSVEHWDLAVLNGAGGIRSTAQDMTVYLKAQMGLQVSDLKSAIKKTHSVQFDSGDGDIDAIGLAWLHSTKHDTLIWHDGGTGGFRSFIGFNIEKGTGVVVLASGTDDINDIGFYLLDNQHTLKKVQVAVPVDKATLVSYTGTYHSKKGLNFYVSREGNQLSVQLSGQPENKIYAKSPTRFFYKVVPAEIEFSKGTSSTPQKLTLYQNGKQIVAQKVNNKTGPPEPEEHTEIKIDPAMLNQYVGTYQIAPNFKITVTKEGSRLMTQATGQQKIQVYPESRTKFFLKVTDAQIEFIRGENGGYTRIKLYLNGQVMEGEKISEKGRNRKQNE